MATTNKLEICSRCNRTMPCHVHHIKPRIEGGSNDPSNLQHLCQDCHILRHTELKILHSLEWATNTHRPKRVQKLQRRLQHLRNLNTPEKIARFGYRTYWDSGEMSLSLAELVEDEEIRRKRRQEEKEGRDLEYALSRIYAK